MMRTHTTARTWRGHAQGFSASLGSGPICRRGGFTPPSGAVAAIWRGELAATTNDRHHNLQSSIMRAESNALFISLVPRPCLNVDTAYIWHSNLTKTQPSIAHWTFTRPRFSVNQEYTCNW